MLSLQALVLCKEPYFNEAGYESRNNNAKEHEHSKKYDDNIKLMTMIWAMTDVIKNPIPGFESAIMKHFRMKKNHIMNKCSEWCNDSPSNMRLDYMKAYGELMTALSSIQDQ